MGWLYVLDPDVGDDWHIVRDLGLMLPKGRALCGQLPPSLGGWPAVMIMLDRAGQEVCGIVLVPALSGTQREPMASM